MSSLYLGEIRLFAGDYVPQGWSACDGTILSIQDNASLFEAVGKTYGGDGLPDLRGSATQGTGAAQTASSIGYLVLNYCIAAEGSFPPKP